MHLAGLFVLRKLLYKANSSHCIVVLYVRALIFFFSLGSSESPSPPHLYFSINEESNGNGNCCKETKEVTLRAINEGGAFDGNRTQQPNKHVLCGQVKICNQNIYLVFLSYILILPPYHCLYSLKIFA